MTSTAMTQPLSAHELADQLASQTVAVIEAINKEGGKAIFVAGDISEDDVCKAMVKAAVVPPLIISAMPSLAERAMLSEVSPASNGQTRSFNHSSSERSSAAPRSKV